MTRDERGTRDARPGRPARPAGRVKDRWSDADRAQRERTASYLEETGLSGGRRSARPTQATKGAPGKAGKGKTKKVTSKAKAGKAKAGKTKAGKAKGASRTTRR